VVIFINSVHHISDCDKVTKERLNALAFVVIDLSSNPPFFELILLSFPLVHTLGEAFTLNNS